MRYRGPSFEKGGISAKLGFLCRQPHIAKKEYSIQYEESEVFSEIFSGHAFRQVYTVCRLNRRYRERERERNGTDTTRGF